MNATIDLVSGGGTAERTFQMSRAFVHAGVDCDVLALDLGLTPERMQNLAGARVFALPCVCRRFYIPLFSPAHIRRIVREADVIHLMGHWTLVNALVYLYARRLGKPYVVCPAGALPIYGRSKLLKRLYNLVVGRRIVKNADGHVAIVEGEIPQFKRYGVGADRISVIHNGIEPEDYREDGRPALRDEYGIGDSPYVLFIGRLNEIKGPDLLLNAFVRAKDAAPDRHLVFAGPDEGMLPGLRAAVRKVGLEDRVHFVGYLGGAEKSRALRSADLLAIPSRREAMSIVVLEAGAAGTPVLLTDRCGFDEVAGVEGGQVVAATSEGLREGLVDLLGKPEELKSMGANLEEFVVEQFSWETAVDKYLELYAGILSSKK